MYMKKMSILFFIFVALGSNCSSAQVSSNPKGNSDVEDIYKGACAFSQKNYAEAQRYFEKALTRNPQDDRLPLFIARSIHAQAIQGTSSVSDVAKAKAAIAAYENVLSKNAAQDEAIDAILKLYERMNQEEQAREWLLQRADSNGLSTKQRAAMFNRLANLFRSAYGKIIYGAEPAKPKSISASELNKAKQWVQQGLDAIEKALQMSSDNQEFWFTKANLLDASARIAGQENRNAEKARYQQASHEALAKSNRLNNIRPDTEETASQANKRDKIPEAIKEFRSSGVLKRSGNLDALISPVEEVTLLTPLPPPPPPPPPPPGRHSRVRKEKALPEETYDPEKERKKRDEERAAKRMAKLPWKDFSPVGEGFSVLMPSPVDETEKNLGNYSVTSEGVYYFINLHSIDKPASVVINTDTTVEMITAIALGAAEQICKFAAGGGQNCEITFVKDLTLPGGAGRQYTVKLTDCSEGQPGVLRAYVSQKNAYVIWVMGAEETDARVSRFLQSFTLK